jgi:hypothetical protein
LFFIYFNEFQLKINAHWVGPFPSPSFNLNREGVDSLLEN